MSAVVVGIWLDKSKKYLLAIRTIPIAGTIIFLLAAVIIPIGNVGLCYIVIITGGCAVVPVIAVCFSLGTEVSHPVQPALVVGLMMGAAQVCLFGMNFVYLAILNDKPPHTAKPIICILVMNIFPFISIFLAFFVKEDLRRLNAHKKKSINE